MRHRVYRVRSNHERRVHVIQPLIVRAEAWDGSGRSRGEERGQGAEYNRARGVKPDVVSLELRVGIHAKD